MSRIKRFNSGWSSTPNDLLNDSKISFKAKGLYAYINSKPDNWDFSIDRMSDQTKEGRDSIRSGIKELEDAGWLQRTPARQKDGTFQGYDYFILDSVKSSLIKPSSRNPTTENTVTLSNKENSKKEESKKEVVSQHQQNPILEKLLEVLPEVDGLPHVPHIIKALEKRGEKWEDYLMFIAINKKSRIHELIGWDQWFWKDYISESYKPKDQQNIVSSKDLTWYKENDINPYGKGHWSDQFNS